jgi:hypothetical protein
LASDEGSAPRKDAAGDQHMRRTRVVIELAGEDAAVSAAQSVLRERLSGSDLEVATSAIQAVDTAVVLTPLGARDDELAHLWIDLRDPDRVTLYLVDGKRERVLVRHFARHQNPEVAREELGHVVELAVIALRAGERIGIGREDARDQLAPASAPIVAAPPPRAEAPVAPPARKAPPLDLRAGAFFEAQAYGGGPELWSGPGLMGEVRRKPASSKVAYGALISAQYRLPANADTASTTMRFEGGAAHLLAVGTVAISRPAELAFALGGGIDLLHTEAHGDRASEVRFAEGHTRLVPALRALVRYEHAIPSLRLFAGLGVDVPVESARYLLARPGESVVLFEAWRIRPFLVVGVQTP